MTPIVFVAVANDVRTVDQGVAIAIGGAVALAALVGGPVSGASMNPACSLGPALVGGDLASLWAYLTAPFLGGLLAVSMSRQLRVQLLARSKVAGLSTQQGSLFVG